MALSPQGHIDESDEDRYFDQWTDDTSECLTGGYAKYADCHSDGQLEVVTGGSGRAMRKTSNGSLVIRCLVIGSLQMNFTAQAANQVWLTDVTEHPTSQGKLYMCAVKDVWSRRIVGYSISDRMTSDLAVNAASR